MNSETSSQLQKEESNVDAQHDADTRRLRPRHGCSTSMPFSG
jgi:hypothetical protein